MPQINAITNIDIKTLISMIELSTTFEEADEILNTFLHEDYRDIQNKINFLYNNFTVKIVGGYNESTDPAENKKIDYEALLTAVIERKWRQ